MSAASVLDLYEALWASSCDMLRAAEAEQWDALAELEATRRDILARLMQSGGDVEPGSRARRDALIQQILANDARVRALTEAWMGELRATLESIQAQRRLAQAYQSA